MNEKTLIAHVDETTQQALNEVTEQVAQAISDEIGPLAEPMQELQSTMAEINEKFNGFSSVTSSIEELRNLVQTSGQAANEILPIQEEITAFQEKYKEETQNLLQSIQANGALLENVKAEQERQQTAFAAAVAADSQTLSAIKAHLSGQKEQAETWFEQMPRDIGSQFGALQQDLEEKSRQLSEKIASLETRLDSQGEQLANLIQTNEKIMLTLDIIVNLVTPFWKRRKK